MFGKCLSLKSVAFLKHIRFIWVVLSRIAISVTRTWTAVKTHVTKVSHCLILVRVYFNHFPKKVCWKKFFHFQFVCCDKMAPRRWSANSSTKCKQQKSQNEKLNNSFQQAFFGVSYDIKNYQDKPKNNSYLICFNWKKVTSYTNLHLLCCINSPFSEVLYKSALMSLLQIFSE